MFIAIFYLAICAIVAVYANRLNRSPFGYFCLALVISPLLGGLLLLALGARPATTEASTT